MKTLEDFLKHTTPLGECLLWTRCINTDGYPRAAWKGSANGKVHRIVYSLVHPKQTIEGFVIRHKCDTPLCINPEHLLRGTEADNMKDRDARERHGQAKVSHAQVRAIRDLAGKYKNVELAAMFGINSRTISSIISCTHFKHVT